jgi:hypothetical protein
MAAGQSWAGRLMRDPLYQDEKRLDRLAADDRVAPVIWRLQWLKLASGLIALGLIAAIWIVWRWPG